MNQDEIAKKKAAAKEKGGWKNPIPLIMVWL